MEAPSGSLSGKGHNHLIFGAVAEVGCHDASRALKSKRSSQNSTAEH